MRGYPKYVATKQDYLNLLSMSEYRERAFADLAELLALDDEEILVCTDRKNRDLHAERATEKKPNRLPLWKEKGFKARSAVEVLIMSAALGDA
jgi:hypothetical protein